MKYAEDMNAELRRTVANFNKRLARLEKQGITNLPEHERVRDLKRYYKNSRDLNRKLSQMKSFTAKSAKSMVRVGKDRVKMSEWQRDVFYQNRRIAQRRAEKDLAKNASVLRTKLSQNAPVQAMKKETMKLKMDELKYLKRDISSMTRSELRTSLATANKVANKAKSDKVFYDNFFDMMFKDAYRTGQQDERVNSIKRKLMELTPEQLNLAYNAEDVLKHFVEYYDSKDFSKSEKEKDKDEIKKMSKNINDLYNRASKIVEEYSEY